MAAEAKPAASSFSRYIQIAITVLAVAFGLFHIYTGFFGVLTAVWQRSIHLGAGIVLAALISAQASKSWFVRGVQIVIALVTLVVVSYFFLDFDGLMLRFGQPSTRDLIIGSLLIILTLDFARRRTGWILPSIAVVFLLYAFVGPYLPGLLWHRGYTFPRIINQISLTTEGIFGTPLGVSANYIFLFVLFGTILEASGIGQFYIDLAVKLVGRTAGGPAKAAIVASSLFGSVSGSAVANVAGTGSITIPLMKSIGYKSSFAGAVEAVASTGGQFMPPLMGASAFIMAEILGIPYVRVAGAALIPALIFYAAVFSIVHFKAWATGLTGTDTSKLPALKTMLLSKGIYLVPIILLVYLMVVTRISTVKAAVYAVGATILIGFFFSGTTWRDLVRAFEKGARTALVVISATASAGIVVAVINLTGLGLRFSSLVLGAAGGHLILVLVFLMLASMLIGMGLPTTPAYLILAVLGAPALIRLGVQPLGAHMFVFYFGALSMITPPVALAVYAASTIAESEFWETAWTSIQLGLSAFIVPFMFVYNPAMLGYGTPLEILSVTVTALIGAIALGAGIAGWLHIRANWLERAVLVVSGLLLIQPGWFTNILGLGGIALVLVMQVIRKKAVKPAG
jgi:TRAP transporter 4TM/12TM fusion protein